MRPHGLAPPASRKSPGASPQKATTKKPAYSSKRQYGYGPQDDPLNIKLPPQGGRGLIGTRPEPAYAGEYMANSINPDSLLADVEALLAQEQMLTEQAQWWQGRAQKELTTRRGLQTELKNQDACFVQEVTDMQNEIANARDRMEEEKKRSEAFLREADDMQKEARTARAEAEVLKKQLEALAKTEPPRNAARIRASISSVRENLIEPPKAPVRAPAPTALSSVPEAGRPIAAALEAAAPVPAAAPQRFDLSPAKDSGGFGLPAEREESAPKDSGVVPPSIASKGSVSAPVPDPPGDGSKPAGVPAPVGVALDFTEAADEEGDGTAAEGSQAEGNAAGGLSLDLMDAALDEEDDIDFGALR